jgi:hypothetical protein
MAQAREFGLVTYDRAFVGAVEKCKSTYVWDTYVVHFISLMLGVVVEKLKLIDWKTFKTIALWCESKFWPNSSQ